MHPDRVNLIIKRRVLCGALGFTALALGTSYAQGPPREAPVSVAIVEERAIAPTLELVGTVEPIRRSTVAAQTAGAVHQLMVEEGDRVETGAPLAILDAVELKIRIETLTSARSELEAMHQDRLESLKRSKKLYDKGRISEEEYREVLHSEHALRFRVEAANGAIRQQEDRLDKTTIRAPFDGVIVRKHAEVGEWVNQGGAIVDILELTTVHVLLDLPEQYAAQIDPDALVIARATGGVALDGKIVAIIPDADPESHTLPVKVEIENRDQRLHAGMFVRATVKLKGRENALLVPKDALVSRGPLNVAFVVQDGSVQEITVERGVEDGALVAVKGRLSAGQQVVIRGNERLRSGQPVTVVESDGGSE
ncbi:MAG: efflux RND transporter periplasmic adaptor subunit [Verrucomicrobia bacterium]|nr:efflux RND transporter periplasmic adaptor subunit [Verrucomicrobiota bacterium]MDA1087972.1 efflux RND transporter periplasmic adaptor subunit [Verrucomicrobiota bacterium]